MSAKSVPFARIQLHGAVGFKQVKFERVFDLNERDTAISQQRPCLLEGDAERGILHGIRPFHVVACFRGRHQVGKACVEMGIPRYMLPKPLNHGSGNTYIKWLASPQQHVTPRKSVASPQSRKNSLNTDAR